MLSAIGRLVGPVQINRIPQEVHWKVPLDEDEDDGHAHYDPQQAASSFVAASRATRELIESGRLP